jgi:hypothetical protein
MAWDSETVYTVESLHVSYTAKKSIYDRRGLHCHSSEKPINPTEFSGSLFYAGMTRTYAPFARRLTEWKDQKEQMIWFMTSSCIDEIYHWIYPTYLWRQLSTAGTPTSNRSQRPTNSASEPHMIVWNHSIPFKLGAWNCKLVLMISPQIPWVDSVLHDRVLQATHGGKGSFFWMERRGFLL